MKKTTKYVHYRYRRKPKGSKKTPLTLDDMDKILYANVAHLFCGHEDF